ncbi:hypothetical protein D0T49_05825 [Paludibacter sp. 221]|nr:hypothetical protein [Paludibacter sp. 221]
MQKRFFKDNYIVYGKFKQFLSTFGRDNLKFQLKSIKTMGFFKLYKPRTYNYRYIYYDPKKEAQKEREEKFAEKNDENGEFKTSIKRGTFREQRDQRNRAYRDNARQSNIRLVIIIAVLFLIAYFILRSI